MIRTSPPAPLRSVRGEQLQALLDHEAAFVVVGQAPVRYWFDDAISYRVS
jgi:hypothetical protein